LRRPWRDLFEALFFENGPDVFCRDTLRTLLMAACMAPRDAVYSLKGFGTALVITAQTSRANGDGGA
jgi:hypothetical protein